MELCLLLFPFISHQSKRRIHDGNFYLPSLQSLTFEVTDDARQVPPDSDFDFIHFIGDVESHDCTKTYFSCSPLPALREAPPE